MHTKKSLKTASKRYPILAFLSNCVKGVEVVGVGELAALSAKLRGSMLYSLGPLQVAGLLYLASFLSPLLLVLLPGSMLDGVQERRSLTAGLDY